MEPYKWESCVCPTSPKPDSKQYKQNFTKPSASDFFILQSILGIIVFHFHRICAF